MKRAAFCWFLGVGGALLYLLVRIAGGIELKTDLMALLPQEEKNIAVQNAKEKVAALLNSRIVLLLGHEDRSTARAAGAKLAQGLRQSGLVASVAYSVAADNIRRLGETLFPYRMGLLTAEDRARLQQGRGQEIMLRALAAVYAPAGIVDAGLLRHDPFLLLPSYLTAIPRPLPRLSPDEGVLSIRDGGRTYVLITARLAGDPYATAFQERFIDGFGTIERHLKAGAPGLRLIRFGAIFYAQAGTAAAMRESTAISVVSFIGTVLLVLAIFRRLRPLGLTLLAIGTGIICAFAASLWIFGSLHVAVPLFGISMIGIALDYCLQYLSARFNPDLRTPKQWLERVFPGIAVGVATTLIGYITLLLAPFPGLHQIAIFSAVGLAAAFATIVLWLPLFDAPALLPGRARLLEAAGWLWAFWEQPRYGRFRLLAAVTAALTASLGVLQLNTEDDIRRLQALSGELKHEEGELRRLTGIVGGLKFILVQAADEQGALRSEEAVLDLLAQAKRRGMVAGFQATAQVIPSVARQRENRALVRSALMTPFLASYYQKLKIFDAAPSTGPDDAFLTAAKIPPELPISWLRELAFSRGGGGIDHVILLNRVSRPVELRRLVERVPGVQFVDPAGDVTRLLSEYRGRALLLLAASGLFMLPVIFWRYGVRGGLPVLGPPFAAVLLTPPLVALTGVPFTFFSAMALVLVLSIGFDYAVFCREADENQRPATMVGVWLAMATTLLSFGLLGGSSVAAVQTFGLTLLVGTLLAFLVSPVAGKAGPFQGRVRRDRS